MKLLFIIAMSCLFLCFDVFCISGLQMEAHQWDLTVRITRLLEDKGKIIACLSRPEDSFLSDCHRSSTIVVKGNDAQVYFDSIEPGTYALAVFQDLNNNGILDKNRLSLPTEPFGFSNDPRLIFGPPNFKRCAFEMDSLPKHLTIKLKRF